MRTPDEYNSILINNEHNVPNIPNMIANHK